jgi:hypothetical protein
MPIPSLYGDGFLGGGGVDPALRPAEEEATIGTSTMALPGDRALDATLRRPGALDPNQAPLPGLTSRANTPDYVPPAPLAPTVVEAAKQRAAMASVPNEVPYAAAGPEVQHTLPPATVAKAKARAAGGGAPKGPTLQQQLLDARAAGGEADIAGVRAQQTAAAMQGDLLDQQLDQAEQRMVERQARQAERDRSIDQQMGQLSQDVDAVKNIRFDANRVFASPAGILGAAASAMRAGANERIMGRNLAEDSLRDAINRDFDEQKANAAQKSTALGAKQNLITMMRANYQDRNQADMAAEIAHKEAAAQQILALAAHSKVPEMQAQADKLAAGIKEDALKLRMQWQAQAAAGAAAAEKERFERMMRVREQLRKEGETDSVIQKNLGEGKDKLDEQTGKLAGQMLSAKIPEREAAGRRALSSLDAGATLTNTNPISNSFAQSFPLVYKVLAGDAAAASQQDFASAKNQILHELSGAAVSASEMERLQIGLENAGTPEDRRRALSNALESLQQAKATILAGASPRAAAEYQRRQSAAAPNYQAEAPQGFIPGGGQ